jgi:hypothetical protein
LKISRAQFRQDLQDWFNVQGSEVKNEKQRSKGKRDKRKDVQWFGFRVERKKETKSRHKARFQAHV